MIQYGHNANSGYLEPDRSEGASYNPYNPYSLGASAIDLTETKNFLVRVLVSEGLNFTQIDPGSLSDLVAKMADDPNFQQTFNSESDASILKYVDNQLFDPMMSSDPAYWQFGVSLLRTQGKPLTSQQQSSIAQMGGTAGVQPFDMKKFGQELGWGDSNGFMSISWNEYQVPNGTPIIAPFGGSVTTENHGKADWGRRLFIHLSNGDTLSFGHLSSFALQGGTVQPGQVIGYSGGDPSDPSSGRSTGAHIDVILQGPNGAYINPASMMTALKNGTSVPGLSATSGPSDVMQTITNVANSLGIDPAIALADAYVESKFNANAIGDNGHSVGLFQLHDAGEGAGMSIAQRENPELNAEIALTQFARVKAANPGIVNNPGLWAALAQRPANQQAYANAVNGVFGDIKSGKMPTADLSAVGGSGFLDALKTQYPGVFSAYQKYYGADPTADQFAAATVHGYSAAAVEQAIRGMPSNLAGLNQGQYTDLKSVVDSASQSALGHAGTDGIIAELHRSGMTSPSDVKNWYDFHAPSQIDGNTYQAIYRANQPAMSAIYNTAGFDPRIAQQQYNQAVTQSGGQAPPAPPAFKQRAGGLQA
jgi:hypothetical protein